MHSSPNGRDGPLLRDVLIFTVCGKADQPGVFEHASKLLELQSRRKIQLEILIRIGFELEWDHMKSIRTNHLECLSTSKLKIFNYFLKKKLDFNFNSLIRWTD